MIKSFLLLERAPLETAKMAEIIVQHLISGTDVAEMRAKRGADFDNTQFYQIRVKPLDKEMPLETILTQIEKFLKSAASKKFGIKEVQINQSSRNSGKFSSVSFDFGGKDYDVVVAQGGNKGENFEKDLLKQLDDHVQKIDSSDQAKAAFAALEKIDKVFKLSNIKEVKARSGSTQRSGDMTPEETGKIIGDIIIVLKNGDEKYISIKNSAGATVAQFGISKAFSEDLKVNTESAEWKNWLKPFGIEPKKIEAGLQAAANGTELDFPDTETTAKIVKEGSPIHKILQKMWGCGYYYLREKGSSFTALSIDKDYVNNELLRNLVVTQIRCPCSTRKQISIYVQSDTMKFKLEVRNPRGRGSVKPTQIQLTVMKGAK